ncbi:MAG: hypothetical protein IPK28_13955 [Devosia sp.]|nr:hypothetical protein [Devosia sp.]
MNLKSLGRLAGVLALTAGLAGCIDMTAEIEVLSETTGRATTNMTMGAEFYPMIKQMADSGQQSADDGFCVNENDVLTENADGSATCTTVIEGSLDDLKSSDSPSEDATFIVVSPGVVRVAMKSEGMASEVTEGQDEQTAQMMKAYFDGHNVTIRIKGKRVIDSNMTVSDDGTTAEIVIPFLSLMDGTAGLPEELFAVVDTN